MLDPHRIGQGREAILEDERDLPKSGGGVDVQLAAFARARQVMADRYGPVQAPPAPDPDGSDTGEDDG